MNSINTTKLVQLKEFENAHRGPGTYHLANEKKDKEIGTALKSAFGVNESRKLDNRTVGVLDNPAPN